jgi:hypothetical protein
MQIGKKKMALDHVLIEQMDADDDAGMDLESILRHGTEALFQDDTQDIRYDSQSIDKLLDRSQIEDTSTGKDDSAESQFSFARVWANDKGTLEDSLGNDESNVDAPDPSIWENILKEREEEVAREAAAREQALGRGKRKRQVSVWIYCVGINSLANHCRLSITLPSLAKRLWTHPQVNVEKPIATRTATRISKKRKPSARLRRAVMRLISWTLKN